LQHFLDCNRNNARSTAPPLEDNANCLPQFSAAAAPIGRLLRDTAAAESNFMPRVLRMINKALQKLFARFPTEQNNIPAATVAAAYFAAEPL